MSPARDAESFDYDVAIASDAPYQPRRVVLSPGARVRYVILWQIPRDEYLRFRASLGLAVSYGLPAEVRYFYAANYV